MVLTPLGKQVCGSLWSRNSADLFSGVKPPQTLLEGDREAKFWFVEVCGAGFQRG